MISRYTHVPVADNAHFFAIGNTCNIIRLVLIFGAQLILEI